MSMSAISQSRKRKQRSPSHQRAIGKCHMKLRKRVRRNTSSSKPMANLSPRKTRSKTNMTSTQLNLASAIEQKTQNESSTVQTQRSSIEKKSSSNFDRTQAAAQAT